MGLGVVDILGKMKVFVEDMVGERGRVFGYLNGCCGVRGLGLISAETVCGIHDMR